MNDEMLRRAARQYRADALTMIATAQTGHLGGSMSSLDILTALYHAVLRIRPEQPDWPDRDRFIMSKGHSVEGYLAVLAGRGFFDRSRLREYAQEGSDLIGHPSRKVPGVDMSTGALGHGLSVGVGCALGARRMNRPFRTYALLGDGELAEGSVWEAAMAASHYGLDNLYAVIDRNGLQISGATEEVMALDHLEEKWRAFGWDVTEIDGHSFTELTEALQTDSGAGKPHCLIAKTVKGKGLPFAENNAGWHHKIPTPEQVKEGLAALGVKEVGW